MVAVGTINPHRFHIQSPILPCSHSKIKDSSQKVHPYHRDESFLLPLLPEQNVLPHKILNSLADNVLAQRLIFYRPVQIPHSYKAYDSLLMEDLRRLPYPVLLSPLK